MPRLASPPAVRQSHEDGCGPACAEMLLRDRGFEVAQAVIAEGMALPATAECLAARMGEVSPTTWLGAFAALDGGPSWAFVAGLTAERGSWAALLEPLGFRHPGHWVVVDGVSDDGVVWIRDPVGQHYGTPIEEFLELWHYTMMVIEEGSQ